MSESYIDEKTNIDPLDTSTTDDNEKRSDEHIGEENRKDLSKYFYFSSSVDDVPLHKYRDYCIHMFCVSGRAVARIGEKTFDIRPNDCVVLLNNHSFSWISISDDFVEHGMFISQKYLSLESSRQELPDPGHAHAHGRPYSGDERGRIQSVYRRL